MWCVVVWGLEIGIVGNVFSSSVVMIWARKDEGCACARAGETMKDAMAKTHRRFGHRVRMVVLPVRRGGREKGPRLGSGFARHTTGGGA